MEQITYFAIVIGAIFVNNVVLAQFLGICPFLGVSSKVETSMGMGAAVTFVMALTALVAWSIQTYILDPLQIQYMQTIVFILVIAALVQMVEIMLKKLSPSLYQALGIFLPLITTNCAVLGVAILMIQKEFTLLQSVVYSVSTALGFALALVLVLALASTAFGIVGPKILSTATTELATGLGRKLSGLGGIDFGKIGKILLTVLALYLVSAACSFFQSWILAGITQKLAYRLRGEISSKIHRMPMRYFARNTVGDVLSRITNDVDTMSSGMAQSVTQLVTNITMLIGVLVMMLRISWLMTLIALIMLPVTGVLTSRIVKRSQRYFVAQQKNLGDINGKVEETYAGHNVVCAFNREGATQKEFDAINARLYRSAWKSQFLSGLMSPVTTFVSKLGYVCVVVLGGSLAAHGTITIGDIQAFISYMSSFTQPITQLAQISTQLQTMAAAAERVFAFLAEP